MCVLCLQGPGRDTRVLAGAWTSLTWGCPTAQPREGPLPVLPSQAHTPHYGQLARFLPDSQCRGSP